ncbi:carbohydrate ABC transporter permease [Cohnella soli]|uniref:Carbohydrate ABC transporter permease n=1 Tax=Cohnella soli TaxID=425005 RepID=A0ABW0I1Z3_9BACL
MRKHKGDWLFHGTLNLLMGVISLLCLYPFYYMLIYSFSDPQEVTKGIFFWPVSFSVQNYVNIFRTSEILSAFYVSGLRTVVGTALTVMCSTIFAYVVTKQDLPFRKTIYRLAIISMYINAGIIPWYMTMMNYGLKNSFLLYILPTAIAVFSVVLIKTFIESIHPAYEESAMIDGAGILVVLFRIVFPLSLPIIAAVAVFSAVGQWNSWYDNMMLVSKPSLKTLQLTLYEILQGLNPALMNMRDVGISMESKVKPTLNSIRITISIITIFPIFLVYPLLQRFFIKGIMVGGIKG